MITTQNYFDTYAQADQSTLPKVIVDAHKFITESVEQFGWEFFDEDAELAETRDLQFEKLQGHLAKKAAGKPSSRKSADCEDVPPPRGKKQSSAKHRGQGPASKKNTRKSNQKPKTSNSGKTQPRKPSESGAKPDIELVRDLDIELRLITRFVNLHNKPKTFAEVLAVFNALNRAAKKGQIRKTNNPTPYHKEMIWIQDKLEKALETAFKGDKPGETRVLQFDEGKIKALQAIRKKFQVHPSVRLGLRYVGMEGRAPERERAQRLLTEIEKAMEQGKVPKGDINMGFMREAAEALEAYIGGKTRTVRTQQAALSGLSGAVLGCACNASTKTKSLSGIGGSTGSEDSKYLVAPIRGHALRYRSDQLPSFGEETYEFTGKWKELLGQPEKGFSAMIYGKPKYGKSTLAADLAGYLARNFGSVLYASIEEGVRGTIVNRFERLGVGHPNMEVLNYLPVDLSGYNFIVMDSVSRSKLSIDQLREILSAYPDKNFIFIFHVTKAGLPRGTAEFEHEVDSVVEVGAEGQVLSTGRFGPPGEIQVRFG